MGQDWVSTGEAWERCLAGCWMRTKQDPALSLFAFFGDPAGRFELFDGEGQALAG